MSADLDGILRRIAELAQRREPLADGLAASDLPGAAGIASALRAGADLRTALGQLLPPDLLDLLAGDQPPLERAALLVAEMTRARAERRQLLIDALAYPALTTIAVIAAAALVAANTSVELAWGWLAAAAPALPLAALCIVASRWPSLRARCGWIGAWAEHIDQESRYRRSALAARWQMPEAEIAALLGADVVAIAGMLGERDAEGHCLRLAEHHRLAARRGVTQVALILTLAIYLSAGAVFLAVSAGIVGAWNGGMVDLGTDITGESAAPADERASATRLGD